MAQDAVTTESQEISRPGRILSTSRANPWLPFLLFVVIIRQSGSTCILSCPLTFSRMGGASVPTSPFSWEAAQPVRGPVPPRPLLCRVPERGHVSHRARQEGLSQAQGCRPSRPAPHHLGLASALKFSEINPPPSHSASLTSPSRNTAPCEDYICSV